MQRLSVALPNHDGMTGVSEGGWLRSLAMRPLIMRQDAVCCRAQTAGSRRGRIYGRLSDAGGGGGGGGAWPDRERELTENGYLGSTCCHQVLTKFFSPPPTHTHSAGLHPHTHEGQDVRLPQSAEPRSTRRRQEGDEDHLVSMQSAAAAADLPLKVVSIKINILVHLVSEHWLKG